LIFCCSVGGSFANHASISATCFEQPRSNALVETFKTEFPRPGAERSVVATTFRFVDVRIAHCRGLADDVRFADRFPAFPSRVGSQLIPRFSTAMKDRFFGMS
jgi:hypothetical protein